MLEVEAVIFDLDGTLIQSGIDIKEMRKRIDEILVEAGVPAGELDMSRRIWEIIRDGKSVLERMRLHPERVKLTMISLTEAMNAVELEAVEKVKPKPNAHKALEKLRELGVDIGVTTRSCNEYATRSLDLTDLARYVDVLLARDDVEHPKPDPRHLLQAVEDLEASISNVVYVGDAITDLETAREAGIVFIGYPRSEDRRRRFRKARCEILIDDLIRVVDLVEGGLRTRLEN